MIAKAEEKDFPGIMFIYRVCVYDMNRQGLFNWNTAYPGAEQVLADIRRGEVWVHRENETILGVVCINQDQPGEYNDIEWKFRSPFLVVHRLAVHPLFRKRGIAAKIMESVRDMAKENGCRSVRLDAIMVNPAAMQLYARAGYRHAGKIFFSYQKDPFMCMELEIGENGIRRRRDRS